MVKLQAPLILLALAACAHLGSSFAPRFPASRTWDGVKARVAPRLRASAVEEPTREQLAEWVQKYKAENKVGDVEPQAVVFPQTASIAEVLAEVFEQVVASENEGGSRVLLFPAATALYDARLMAQLSDHLDLCKECCEVLGTSQNAVSLHPGGPSAYYAPAPAVAIRPIAQGGGEVFGDDPYWDDDDDSPPPGLDFDDYDEEEDDASRLYSVPEDDQEIIQGMREWVGAVIADLGVCPFTVDEDRAGLPVGKIRYEVTRDSLPEAVYSTYWREVALVSGGENEQTEKELSTTLLVTPNFGMRNREFFESFSNTLTQPLESLGLEEDVQLVFFHPEWVFRDGADRIGDDGAANFARRSPWPMINILRTPQVRKAQKAIPTGLVYRQNEATLDKIGADRLQRWLLDRDWSEVKDNFRVDRRSIPILSTAQDLLQGKVAAPLKDTDVALEPTLSSGADDEGAEGWAPGDGDDDGGDDWDEPFDSLAAIELEDDEARRRRLVQTAEDSRAVVGILRRRLSQEGPLSPSEVKELQQLAKRLNK